MNKIKMADVLLAIALILTLSVAATASGCATTEEPEQFHPTDKETTMWGCEELKKRDAKADC